MSQPGVGFLTLLERLHYCTVGWNLKNPLHPVWVLASETHLTGETGARGIETQLSVIAVLPVSVQSVG